MNAKIMKKKTAAFVLITYYISLVLIHVPYSSYSPRVEQLNYYNMRARGGGIMETTFYWALKAKQSASNSEV